MTIILQNITFRYKTMLSVIQYKIGVLQYKRGEIGEGLIF